MRRQDPASHPGHETAYDNSCPMTAGGKSQEKQRKSDGDGDDDNADDDDDDGDG